MNFTRTLHEVEASLKSPEMREQMLERPLERISTVGDVASAYGRGTVALSKLAAWYRRSAVVRCFASDLSGAFRALASSTECLVAQNGILIEAFDRDSRKLPAPRITSDSLALALLGTIFTKNQTAARELAELYRAALGGGAVATFGEDGFEQFFLCLLNMRELDGSGENCTAEGYGDMVGLASHPDERVFDSACKEAKRYRDANRSRFEGDIVDMEFEIFPVEALAIANIRRLEGLPVQLSDEIAARWLGVVEGGRGMGAENRVTDAIDHLYRVVWP